MQSTDPLLDPRRLKDPPSALNVKLSRTSTARPLLYSKTNHEMLNRLAVIIQDSKNIHESTTKGKLPVEAAYTVMKRVTEAAGEPLIPTGLSTFNKLQSLRTDPALKVLKSQTWKTFFNSTANERSSPDEKGHRLSVSGPSKQTQNLNGEGGKTGSRRPSRDIAAQQQVAVLERVFANLIVRIEDLWDQLRIPAQERQFYHKTAFKATIDCYEPCKNLAMYIEMLELHKELTKDVIFAIHAREEAVKKCYDTLSAIRRKLQRANNNNAAGGTARPASASATLRPSSSTPSLTDAQVVDESGRMAFWKEELIVSLDEIRCASLEVIKAIQQWRRILWRPHAFVWCGVNYLYKMQEDMNVLETDIYQRILSMVPLTKDDILCVIFSPAAKTNAAGEPVHKPPASSGSNNANSSTANSPTEGGLRRTLSRSPSHRSNEGSPSRTMSRSPSRRGSSNGRPSTAGAYRQRLYMQQQQYEKIDATLRSLLEAFRDNIDVTELHAAARVVIDEYKLQQAIQTEKDALHFKGVFIPLLKSRKDLRDDDLAFYHRQQRARDEEEANEAADPPAPSQDSRTSQVPFSPQNRRDGHRRSAARDDQQEELYDDDRRGASHFHFNSTHLEPPAPSSSAPSAATANPAPSAAPVLSSSTTTSNRQNNHQHNDNLPNDRYYQADFDENE